MWVVIIEAGIALVARIGRSPSDAGDVMPDTVILMPAHNEEGVIGQTLASLAPRLPERCRILCVAHNCSDATAEIARGHGAEVIEVADAGTGGKPDALKAGLRWLDHRPPEIVVVIDADCVVSSNTVKALATEAKQLNHPVMGAYFFTAPKGGQQVASVSSLAVMLKNFIRPLGLYRLGLPCLLNGSGSAYPFRVIRDAPHGEGSIAEDYQLTIDLLRKGYPTTFLPEARVDGQLPTREQTAVKQRRRWEHGHLFLSFLAAPRLLLEGVMRLDRERVALALELAVPPLAFLALMWGVALMPALAVALFWGGGPLGLLLATAGLFALAVTAAWMRFAGAGPTLAALAAVPGYLLWKLPIYRDFFGRRETRWMKTSRD
jgi:cellulose synthase/poly-beta-1,6-N-acetylglucosamine synthase-like glycosyltransferase